MLVFSLHNLSIDFCIASSVWVSMLAVASSSTNIDGLCAKILANAINCFSPFENAVPLSFATSSIPSFCFSINASADETSMAS